MAFRVGQKVVCINVKSTMAGRVPKELVLNRVYIISGIDDFMDCYGDFGVFLAEVHVKPACGHADSFKAYRFHPATGISIFTEILHKATKRQDA